MGQTRLLGGWGYNNLGDEAILAGYLETLSDVADLHVTSVDPQRTLRAQRKAWTISQEGSTSGIRAAGGVLCGGGYLNGGWLPEILWKLRRLQTDRNGCETFAVHAVEVRGLAGSPVASKVSKLFADSDCSVRDLESQREMEALGADSASVLPDAISLLYPYLGEYLKPVPELNGKVLLNLLDITKRPDRDEFELDLNAYLPFVEGLVHALGDQAVGLIIGDGDYKFLRQFKSLALVAPTSVEQLVSGLAAASAVVSVRMHPALISTALGTPVLSVPYCGKVTPTLSQIGVDAAILRHLSVDRAMAELNSATDYSIEWTQANSLSQGWLMRALGVGE